MPLRMILAESTFEAVVNTHRTRYCSAYSHCQLGLVSSVLSLSLPSRPDLGGTRSLTCISSAKLMLLSSSAYFSTSFSSFSGILSRCLYALGNGLFLWIVILPNLSKSSSACGTIGPSPVENGPIQKAMLRNPSNKKYKVV